MNRQSRRLAVVALVVDLVLVVAFAAAGRRSHDEGTPILGTLEVAAPFLIGVACAAVFVRYWRDPLSLRVGALTWSIGMVAGMLLRRLVFDRGTATPFVIVAFVSTAVLLLGWRLVVRLVRARSRPSPAS